MEIVKPRLSCVKLDPDPYWQKQLEKNSWIRIRKKLIPYGSTALIPGVSRKIT